MEKEKIIEEVVKVIRRYLAEDYKIYLFGSWAKGDAIDTSDLDIGILGKEKAPRDLMMRIENDVQGIPTLRKIDIVDFLAVGEEFRNNALKYAKILN